MLLKKPTVLYHTPQATKTRREILGVAVDIASAEGLENLSIGRLAAELGMSKTGIFAHFGSKERLQLAAVDTAKEIFLAEIVKPALRKPRGIQRLESLLEGWLGYVERIVFRGGCFFAAAAAEFDSRPGPIRDQIAALSKAWLNALQVEIAFARKKRQLSNSVSPAQFAFELHAYVQEANWTYKLFDDKSAFLRARRAIASRLALLSARDGRRQSPIRPKRTKGRNGK